jgi:hypothetical protein
MPGSPFYRLGRPAGGPPGPRTPRFFVFNTEAAALAAGATIWARVKQFYTTLGYVVDVDGTIVGKRLSDGVDQPSAARTTAWAVPRQRLDGKWVLEHTETSANSDLAIDAQGTPVWQFLQQEVTGASVEEEADGWFPRHGLTRAE